MEKVIYYFSGSGYSYLAAKELSEKLKAELVPVKRAAGIIPDPGSFDSIGFVFPVYHASYGLSGIPFILEKFISSLAGLENKYIFAVCTHGGKPGTVLRSLEKLIKRKGGKLSYGACIRLSVPYRADEKIKAVFLRMPLPEHSEDDRNAAGELYARWRELLPKMAVRIENRKSIVMGEGYEAGLLDPVNNILQLKMARTRYRNLSDSDSGTMEVLINRSDAGFRITGDCTGCGLCMRICPVGDIQLENSRPRWLGRCENCFACFHWCPQKAIAGPLVEFEKHATAAGVAAEDLI